MKAFGKDLGKDLAKDALSDATGVDGDLIEDGAKLGLKAAG